MSLEEAEQPPQLDASKDGSDTARLFPDETIGILGAGIGGLYTALILDSLDIEYDILEASNRAGGRMFTYKFPGGGKYDYYDAGAMRFPLPQKDNQGRYKTVIMKRLAELIDYGPLNQGRDRLKNTLIPFYFQAKNGSNPGAYYFSGMRSPPFGGEAMGVDTEYLRVGVEAIFNDVVGPFVRMLVQDAETGEKKGWEMLMANDGHTLRSYMATKYIPSVHLGLPPQHLPSNVIDWCAPHVGFTEHALSEVVRLSVFISFTSVGGNDNAALQWRCFEGGSETLPRKIEEYLNKRGKFVQFGNRVTAISQGHMTNEIPNGISHSQLPVDSEDSSSDYIIVNSGNAADDSTEHGTRRARTPSMIVTLNDMETRDYSHVISTLPLSVLRTIDTSSAGLDIVQRKALHEVDYPPILKIGILFKSNWWTTKLGIVGGQSVTDLPLRMIVYPSYGVDSSAPSKVLIAAYTWGGDAHRLGTLATMSKRPDALKELALRNLAEVHSGLDPDITYEYLMEEFVDIHVKDWIRDEYAMGALTTFPPGGFRDLYPSLIRPAARNQFHFAGEAVSTHHGWVLGALDSAWRAVHECLEVTGQEEKMTKFKMLWGDNVEWLNAPEDR